MNVNRFVNSVVAIALVFAIGWLVEGIWREQCGKWGAENRLLAEQAAAQRAREAEWAARPRLPSHPELTREPEGSMSQTAYCLAVSDQGGPGNTWTLTQGTTNPPDATNSPAKATIGALFGNSNTVRFTMGANHFSLPDACSGVLVQIKWFSDSSPAATDVKVQLTEGGSQLGTDNKAANAALPATLAFVDYGGLTSLWGFSGDIPASTINDPSLGVDIVVNGSGFSTADIEEVDITVYEAAGSGNPIKLKCGGVVGAWVNPENALLEDGAYATNSLPLGNGVPLDGTMEGNHFSVASDQHIWKVLVRVLCMADAPGIKFSLVQLMYQGNPIGSPLSSDVEIPMEPTWFEFTFEAASVPDANGDIGIPDLTTVAIANDPSFGVRIEVSIT